MTTKWYKSARVIISLFLVVFFVCFTNCKKKEKKPVDYLTETEADKDLRMKWWRDARFGMFIHWGAYSVPAGIHNGKEIPGIGEWIMSRAKIPIPEYEKYVKQFNPIKFDAKEWVRIAKNAGMKYIVITSKHHDGFCLWDSKVSDYDIMDAAPFKRDILKELAKACKKENIKLCFYHSIMDWHHPDAKGENFAKYRDEYLKPQLKELLTDYGDIGVLWFDGEWIKEWTEPQGKELFNYVRNIKPDLIVNNRVGKGRQGMQGMNKDKSYAGDFGTPEQEILSGMSDFDWEACMTMNDTWGFKKNDHNWKSAERMIHNLADIAAKGGNYLLNVGPTSEGLIPDSSIVRLKEMGNWLNINKEAIYQTGSLKRYKEGENIRFTISGDKKYVYLIALKWPGEDLYVKGIDLMTDGKISLLGYRKELKYGYDAKKGIKISIPEELQNESSRPCKYAWVFKIETIITENAES
ncbi:alpha-L-fucosidase [Bacteroidota bacterium]